MRGGWRRRTVVALTGTIAVWGAASAFAAEGDAARGERLAKRWCANCHAVATDQKQASSDAPSFQAIASGERTAASLTDFLTLPGTTHSKMPDLQLSRVEIADVVAHLMSKKK
ncbi:MAG: c-type cytochrome [Siculibacillus sp.]